MLLHMPLIIVTIGANILMDLHGHVKIADFGASKLLRVSLQHYSW